MKMKEWFDVKYTYGFPPPPSVSIHEVLHKAVDSNTGMIIRGTTKHFKKCSVADR